VNNDLKSFTRGKLTEELTRLGLPDFRTKQIFKWLWQKGVTHWEEMTDIAKPLREELSTRFYISELKQKSRLGSAKHGAVKYLFQLGDGKEIESVWLKDANRRTVCVSTQVGCNLGCNFCRTSHMGFKRNLTAGEIAGQVIKVAKGQSERITNVVFMGMGEPLLNYDATLDAARILNDDFGLKIGARKITISTAGVIPGIKKMAGEPEQFKLAVSLNAADQKTRERLMPISTQYPLNKLIPAIKEFIRIKNKRVTFEYVMLKNINDTRKDAENLIMLLSGIPCKINLIPFNAYPGCAFEPSSEGHIAGFRAWLMPHLPTVTIRKSQGSKILAGCGQLAVEKNT